MEYIIKNQYLSATISSMGAELRTLIDKDGVNRLHNPSNDTWNRVSPILFPQISRMPNSVYSVEGEMYKMTTHGFIRDNELELVNHNDTEITFMYKTNENTLKMYPYDFIFYVSYKLVDNTLEVHFKVENPSNKVLRYMLGGHPGFKVPLYDNEDFTDYSILFNKKETCRRMAVVDGWLSDHYDDYMVDRDIINLHHYLFCDDALIFRDLRSSYVDLVSKKHDKKIRFHFSDFEILAIWSKTKLDVNLLCLEPWNGVQHNFVIDHEEMGVFEIKPHGFDYFSYKIEVI